MHAMYYTNDMRMHVMQLKLCTWYHKWRQNLNAMHVHGPEDTYLLMQYVMYLKNCLYACIWLHMDARKVAWECKMLWWIWKTSYNMWPQLLSTWYVLYNMTCKRGCILCKVTWMQGVTNFMNLNKKLYTRYHEWRPNVDIIHVCASKGIYSPNVDVNVTHL